MSAATSSDSGTPCGGGSERRFREARRRDWRVVCVSHALALGLSTVVLIGLCAPGAATVPVVLIPHYFYWFTTPVLALSRPLAWGLVVVGILGPIWAYRAVSYYRRAGTQALLSSGLRGRWAEQPWYRRAKASLWSGLLPTWLLVRQGAPSQGFEPAELPSLRPPGKLASHLLLTLAISLNHWPVVTAFEVALCVRIPWALRLPSWAGPCELRAVRNVPSHDSACR